MQVNLQQKTSTNNQLSTKSGKHILNKTLNVSFIQNNQLKINSLFQSLKENCVFCFPDEIYLSVAKIKVAIPEYLKLVEYEAFPNYEDLKDFTGSAINDEDIVNYELFTNHTVFIDDVYTNSLGETEPISETISDESYEKLALDDILYESLNLLPNQEREMLMYRFGLDNYDELNINQLSKLFHMSIAETVKSLGTALKDMKNILNTMM